MTTHAEQLQQESQERREAFFAALPPEVRLNTDLSNDLKHHLLENSLKQAAYTLARCIEAKVWEAVAVLPAAGRHAKVNHYTPVQWMRDYLDHDPEELMRILLGFQPDPRVAAGAALSLVAVVRETEPVMFSSLRDRWKERLQAKADLENGDWTVACRQFDKATANPVGTNQHEGSGAGPTGSTRAENGSTDAVARRLEKHLGDPEACRAKGTTPERVQEAYDLFLTERKQHSLDSIKQQSGLWGETVREARSQVSTTTTAERLGQWLLKHWPKERLQALTRYLMENIT